MCRAPGKCRKSGDSPGHGWGVRRRQSGARCVRIATLDAFGSPLGPARTCRAAGRDPRNSRILGTPGTLRKMCQNSLMCPGPRRLNVPGAPEMWKTQIIFSTSAKWGECENATWCVLRGHLCINNTKSSSGIPPSSWGEFPKIRLRDRFRGVPRKVSNPGAAVCQGGGPPPGRALPRRRRGGPGEGAGAKGEGEGARGEVPLRGRKTGGPN